MLFVKPSGRGHLSIRWLLHAFISSSISTNHHGRLNSTPLYPSEKVWLWSVLVPPCGQYVLVQSVKWEWRIAAGILGKTAILINFLGMSDYCWHFSLLCSRLVLTLDLSGSLVPEIPIPALTGEYGSTFSSGCLEGCSG